MRRARPARRGPFGSRAGLTLIEVLIAVSLLSLLSLGMLFAMRVGLSAFSKADERLMSNRRVAGAQRIVEQEIEGFMPVNAACGAAMGGPTTKLPFFQGEPEAMRFVSTFSLQQGWRGQPQILEIFVIPGEEGKGVRLVVNEVLYTGPLGAGQFCVGAGPPGTGTRFLPVTAKPESFVLADKLASCRFQYLERPDKIDGMPRWRPNWVAAAQWPMAIRIEMEPLDQETQHLQPITVTAPIRLYRNTEVVYADQ